MSIQTFYVAQGDLLPLLEYIPQDGDGATVVVQVGDTVVFSMRNTKTKVVPVSRAAAVVVAGSPNFFRYTWVAGDTATAGTYQAEWEWMNAGKPQTFPNSRHAPFYIEILDDIA